MKKIVSSLLCVFVVVSGAVAFAQTPPVIDGIVSDGEYPVFREVSGMRLGFSLSTDGATIHAYVSARTGGWVALGFGSPKMNGSRMVLAYVKAGAATFTENLGKGWSHAPTETFATGRAARELDGWTTLEVAVPATRFLKGGSLDVIAAWGRNDDFRSRHSGRTSLAIRF